MARQFLALLLLLPFVSCGQRVMQQPAVEKHRFRLGNKNITVLVSDYGGKDQPVYLNLHDNETTSVEAAVPLLRERGGKLIRIINDGERIIRFRMDGREYAFDPNRMFSHEGIAGTLVRFKRVSNKAIDGISRFAAFYLSLLPKKPSMIIALHNNTDGDLSINNYVDEGEDVEDAQNTSKHETLDPDDFMLTTEPAMFEAFRSTFNIILQHNDRVKKDGSLSVYFGQQSIPYLNIETEHGHKKEFAEMLQAVHLWLDKAGM